VCVDRSFVGVGRGDHNGNRSRSCFSTSVRTRAEIFSEDPLCPRTRPLKSLARQDRLLHSRTDFLSHKGDTTASMEPPLSSHLLCLHLFLTIIVLNATPYVLACGESSACAPLKHHLEECARRVEGGAHEDCIEELYHFLHCVNDCVSSCFDFLFRSLPFLSVCLSFWRSPETFGIIVLFMAWIRKNKNDHGGLQKKKSPALFIG